MVKPPSLSRARSSSERPWYAAYAWKSTCQVGTSVTYKWPSIKINGLKIAASLAFCHSQFPKIWNQNIRNQRSELLFQRTSFEATTQTLMNNRSSTTSTEWSWSINPKEVPLTTSHLMHPSVNCQPRTLPDDLETLLRPLKMPVIHSFAACKLKNPKRK